MSARLESQQRGMERRSLTVMFCDLAGSTALSRQLDAEELAEVLATYQDAVTQCVLKYDGTIARYIGDGILAYFGYPSAHENAAEHAIRASMAAIAAVNEITLASGEPLCAHIGIASGEVVIGNLGPSATRDLGATALPVEISAIGETPNLAAALEKLAGPNTVLISSHTRRLAGKLFRYRDFGQHELKGFDQPVRVWQVISERLVSSRFRALRVVSHTPLVGREGELDRLNKLWETARNGRGQAVLVSGEAGVGKSRLVETLVRRSIGRDSLHHWFHCAPYSESSALAPLVNYVEQLMGAAGKESHLVRLRKLESVLSFAEQEIEDIVPLFADLLSIDYGASDPVLKMSPQRRRQRLFEVILSAAQLLAQKKPLTVVIEDLHWIDPSSQELIEILLRSMPALPVMVILTARPEYTSPWDDLPNFKQIDLAPLQRGECLQMISTLTGPRPAPQSVIDQIIDRADGIPLFVEDLTQHVIQSLETRRPNEDNGSPSNNHLAVTVPTTLQGTLMSRLDRLGETALRVAQVASVLGRDFSYEMLSEMAGIPYKALIAALEKLGESQLLVKQRNQSVTAYSFKHALIRDAAYSSLLKKQRRKLHAHAAQLLHTQVREQQPELIAYHYEIANEIELAVDYWLAAGRRSAKRSSFVEAIDQLNHALALIEDAPKSESMLEKEIALYIILGGAQTGYRGFSATEAGEAYNRALKLAHKANNSQGIFSALSGAGSYYITRAEFARCRELANQCLERAENQAAIPPFVIGKRLLGGVQFMTGEIDAAIQELEYAVSLYDEHTASFQDSDLLYVQDHKSTALCYLALAYTVSGQLDKGLNAARESLAHSRRRGDLHTTNFSLTYLAAVHHFRRDTPATLDTAAQSLELALEQGFATWVGVSRMIMGEHLVFNGEHEQGLQQIVQGMEKHGTTQAIAYQPFGISLLAKALMRVGRFDDARDAVQKALSVIEQYNERWYLPELWRLLGMIASARNDDDAEGWLHKAIELAREQGALFWELRAVTELALLMKKQGKPEVARELIAPVYKQFTEGLSTWHLREAQQLLE
jgi:class 3 adenylate cyclase/tetratricopeptide (TPR) repeat protein